MARPPPTPFLEAPTGGRRPTNKWRKGFACQNPFPLTCTVHGNEIWVRCNRWRRCEGCARVLALRLRERWLAGIEQVPAGRRANFVTLTFPSSRAPDESEAHAALRSLIRRLRYRDQLGAFGWVLHRQRNRTLHYHGIFQMPWLDKDLEEWRELIVRSGFGTQNRLVRARPEHAGYCARYISTRLASLAPMRRAYSFSRDFPKAKNELLREQIAAAGLLIGLRSECEWIASHEVR